MITEIEEISHLFELLPSKCLYACNGMGDNYAACKSWVQKLSLNIPREICIELLREYDTWDDEELEDEDQEKLNIKLLWIAAVYGG